MNSSSRLRRCGTSGHDAVALGHRPVEDLLLHPGVGVHGQGQLEAVGAGGAAFLSTSRTPASPPSEAPGWRGPGDRHRQDDLPAQLPVDLLGGALGHDPALVQDEHPVAGGLHLLQDVGGEDDRLLLAQALDELADLDDLVGVQPGGGLVQDEDLGVVDDGLGQAGALPEALGQGVDAAVHHRLQAALPDDLADALGLLAARQAPGVGDEVQVLHHVQVRVQRGVLGQVADRTLDGQRIGEHVAAVERRGAVAGVHEAGEDLHDRRLAGPVGPQQADHLPRLDGEAHSLDRLQGAVTLAQIRRFDHRPTKVIEKPAAGQERHPR